ncbi:MAG: amidohydrolase family protein [Halioglobus sp.]
MPEEKRHDSWLRSVSEAIVDPEREIIDPHHHLWRELGLGTYLLPEFLADTGAGHHVIKSVFIECGVEYHDSGPEHLRSVGETAFVADIARQSELAGGTVIAGIVAHADLRHPALDEALAAHGEAGAGLFRGIRHALASSPDDAELMIPGRSVPGLYADTDFQSGVRALGKAGLSYDSWHFHYQNPEFLALAQNAPNTLMILDHFGTPLGVGRYASQRQEIFQQWQQDVSAIAQCDNVVAKLGGMAMPDNGFGWFGRDTPPGSDEFVLAQQDYYHHMIECFGPERCMFESNFPVDKFSLSYPVLWNGLKKIASRYSDAEQQALFSKTAERVYRLES